MRKSILFVIAALSAIVFSSCSGTAGEADLDAITTQASSKKIINLGGESSSSSILVKLTEGSSQDFLSSLQSTGIVKAEKVFGTVSRKSELDRWYEAYLEADIDLDTVANALAALDEVELVQYNTYAEYSSEDIAYAFDPSVPVTKADSPIFDDPYLSYQWALNNTGDKSIANSAREGADIKVKDVWSGLTCGDPSIVVAVIDQGIQYSHPDLAANMWVNSKEIPGNGIDDDGNGYVDDVYGYNFMSDSGTITSSKPNDTGHATHCAGIIAAVNNNGVGISGVAGGSGKGDGCRIMSCQIFDDGQFGTSAQIAKAIIYATDNGASVISASIGHGVPGLTKTDNSFKAQYGVEYEALRYFVANASCPGVVDGGIAVYAAGNHGAPYACYPGAMEDIICVSAIGPDNLPTFYTNYAAGCNISAPGGERFLAPWTNRAALILSTVPNDVAVVQLDGTETKGYDYAYMSGTSMACPYAAGVIALGLSYAKQLGKHFTRQEMQDMFLASADDLESLMASGVKKDYQDGLKTLDLSSYRSNMGTGSVDAWNFMMHIAGVPTIIARIGEDQGLDISSYFNTAQNLTFLGVEISNSDMNSLGLTEKPSLFKGKLYVHPTKLGSGKVTVYAVAGGSAVGGGNNPTGGMKISQEISIVTRSFASYNGGWL